MIPKFRAWDENGKRYEGSEVCLIGELVIKSGYSATRWEEEAQLFNLCQYTGLKDKDGVEIYEGDILKVGTLEGEPIGYVKWSTDLVEYRVTNHINPFGDEYLSSYHARQFEVIGNVHENPELMEVAG